MTETARKTCALVVEDDPNIVDLIRSNLAVRGFDTVVSVDGMRALQLLETEDPDIVLLDLMLPEADGFELCRQIRERSPVAIIVVSARGGERDKVTALHMGADDYLTKPFAFAELVARVGSLGRRARPALPPVLERAGIRLDLPRRQAWRDGLLLELTPKEFVVLEVLMRAEGAVVSAEELLEKAWDENADPFTNAVRVAVMTLRRKLGQPPAIETVPGVGYRLGS